MRLWDSYLFISLKCDNNPYLIFAATPLEREHFEPIFMEIDA